MRRALDGWATGLLAAVVEAWHELRIHKLRVLLSLFGVMIAVASLTAALAAAGIAKQVLVEQNENQGRPATLGISVGQPDSGRPLSPDQVRPALSATAERLGVTYWSMRGYAAEFSASHGGLLQPLELSVVDPPYAAMHRIVTNQGRWLEGADTQNLSPAVVVDTRLLDRLGLPADRLPVTIELGASTQVTATIVGTIPRTQNTERPLVYMLSDTYEHWFGADNPLMGASYEMWVPVPGSRQLGFEVGRALAAELPGYDVSADRHDYLAYADHDPLREVTLVVSGIAGVILLLGALSLLNVALVTIQQRVREVGIRRSFGATTGRVFFSVMMESVVATVAAGAIGVLVAVALISNPWVAEKFLDGIDDLPPFPIDAALLGLVVSVGVGVFAGVLPALVAARVKVVDAIRF